MLVQERQLFVDLLRFTQNHKERPTRENFFTAALLGVIREDPVFARKFAQLLAGRNKSLGGHNVSAAKVTAHAWTHGKVRKNGRHLRCHPDLILELRTASSDRPPFRIALEIKLGAPETTGPSGIPQLLKYADLRDVDALAYMRGFAVSKVSARKRKKYLGPRDGRAHFLWSDLYPLFEAGARRRHVSAIHRAMLGLLDFEHLAPMHPLVGFVHQAPTRKALTEARAQFREHWRPTQDALRALASSRGETADILPVKSTGEFYLGPGHSLIYKAAVSPQTIPGAVRYWMYVDARWPLEQLAQELGTALAHRWPGSTCFVPSRRTWNSVVALVPYRAILRGARTESQLGPALAKATVDVFSTALKSADSLQRKRRKAGARS